MRRLIQFAICFVVVLTVVNTVMAQDNTPVDGEKSSLTITGSASAERARFTAPSSAIQIRLEVYNSGGGKVFDTEVRGGNVFDWNLQDGQLQPLTDGSYLCVVTI